MDVYLVGGAIRDELLGKPVTDRDWVVVGAEPRHLLEQGYTQVGRDFPVFLHPQSHEEYALARTERKSGPGHRGFTVHADAEVTLEEDLARRDLTINAIARSADGVLVDPFGGVSDLQNQRLRHVSAAFSEDPLRVLRIARFSAQLPGFMVVAETQVLMSEIVSAGGLEELPAERVGQELSKLLEKLVPVAPFFRTLEACGGLVHWFAELQGSEPVVPAELLDADLRYAALCWKLSAAQATALGRRLKVSTRRQRLSLQVTSYGADLAAWRKADTPTLSTALQALGAFKDPRWLEAAPAVVAACANCSLASLGDVVEAINRQVTTQGLLERGLSGPALGRALAAARTSALREAQG